MPNKQEENEPKKEVLDLIGGSPKKKRAPQPEPAPAPSRPAPVKKEALDLLSGPKKKAPASAPSEPATACPGRTRRRICRACPPGNGLRRR